MIEVQHKVIAASNGLQVLLFPFQAGGSGPGREQDFIVTVPDFPMLSGVVEFDVGSPGDFEPAKFMKR
jgi:hypothetical protein